jgi:hypothetical protein
MLGPRVHRSHAISDPAATTFTTSFIRSMQWLSSRRRSLDRLSLRFGQRFMIGGLLPIPIVARGQWRSLPSSCPPQEVGFTGVR